MRPSAQSVPPYSKGREYPPVAAKDNARCKTGDTVRTTGTTNEYLRERQDVMPFSSRFTQSHGDRSRERKTSLSAAAGIRRTETVKLDE